MVVQCHNQSVFCVHQRFNTFQLEKTHILTDFINVHRYYIWQVQCNDTQGINVFFGNNRDPWRQLLNWSSWFSGDKIRFQGYTWRSWKTIIRDVQFLELHTCVLICGFSGFGLTLKAGLRGGACGWLYFVIISSVMVTSAESFQVPFVETNHCFWW